jgi:hypothetical protein
MDSGLAKDVAIGTTVQVEAGDAEVGGHAAEGMVGPGFAIELIGFSKEVAALAELSGEGFSTGDRAGVLGKNV